MTWVVLATAPLLAQAEAAPTPRNVILMIADGAGYATWDQLGTGLPNALVYDLDYDATDDVLVVGTMGRGSWKLTNISATVPVELQWMQVE